MRKGEHLRAPTVSRVLKLIKFIVNTGSFLEQMRWVQLHPSILGNGCMHPSIFRAATSILIFCLLFPVNVHILHPSIEISNKGTDFP